MNDSRTFYIAGSFQGKLEATTKQLLETGYQQQLTYKLVLDRLMFLNSLALIQGVYVLFATSSFKLIFRSHALINKQRHQLISG